MNKRTNDMHVRIIMESIASSYGLTWEASNNMVRTLLPGYASDPTKLTVDSILTHVYENNNLDKIESLVGEAAEILATEHGMQLPMPGDTLVHETNDTDEYFLARLRTRIVDLGHEPLIEDVILVESKFRAINHIEDLILVDGFKGLTTSIKVLRGFVDGSIKKKTTIKWDGSPAIVFGRNEAGEFLLTDKSGYSAKGYDGKTTSAKALGQMFSDRKPPMDAERQAFVKNMMDIFDEYEKATPKDFRGILTGDLMYFNTPPVQGDSFSFTPNVVTYAVTKNSDLGRRIGLSKSGVVVHKYTGNRYSSTEQAASQLQGTDVCVMPPSYVPDAVAIDVRLIDKIEAYATQHMNDIKQLFNPADLKGIANIHSLFYKYINNSVDTGLDNLGSDFTDWLNTEQLSDKKRANVDNYLIQNKSGVAAMWVLISTIMKAKDKIIGALDAHSGDISQSINGNQGGEGYVVELAAMKIKLVPRGTFTAANRAAHR